MVASPIASPAPAASCEADDLAALAAATAARPVPPRTARGEARLLDDWVAIQAINLGRHARSLRPFAVDEFGSGPAAPSEAHVAAVNRFLDGLRARLLDRAAWVEAAAQAARGQPTPDRLRVLLERKEEAGKHVLYVEGIWDFYFDLFVQRLSTFGERLRACDRIGANCYEDLYVGLGNARSVPALLPFCYAQSGFSPATYRRGVPLRRLRHNRNLFPLITLPQHRLDNVWALSSVLHEVSHNLQADVGLWDVMPKLIFRRLTADGGLPPDVAAVWARWHKEMTADMLALLLGGPDAVESLMDVVGRSPANTVRFSPLGVHPTPYLRVPISLVLLRRMGLGKMADDLGRVWRRLYPRVTPADIPPALTATFDRAAELAVDTMVFQPHTQLANKSVAQLLTFGPEQMAMVETAGRRLAAGQDVGTVPPRFMVGAARFALEQGLAPPQTITQNFYRTLGRR